MRNSAPAKKLATVALLFCVAVACRFLQSNSPNKLTSPDGKFQLTVPADWSKASGLNDQADIQAQNKLKDMYAIVLIEREDDFAKDMTLEKFTEITRKSLMSKYDSPESSTPKPVSINGNEARQYELQGTKKETNARVDLLITTVMTPAHYHQILVWTLPSRMSENKKTLKQVTESFRSVSE